MQTTFTTTLLKDSECHGYPGARRRGVSDWRGEEAGGQRHHQRLYVSVLSRRYGRGVLSPAQSGTPSGGWGRGRRQVDGDARTTRGTAIGRAAALGAVEGARDAFDALSYSTRKEFVRQSSPRRHRRRAIGALRESSPSWAPREPEMIAAKRSGMMRCGFVSQSLSCCRRQTRRLLATRPHQKQGAP